MATIQRPQRGSRISTFYPVKSLPSLASLDSAFQLQEYISLVIRLDVHDVDSIVSVPGKGKEQEHPDEADGGDDMKSEEKDAEKDRKNEHVVDEACWIYEQLRRLAQDLSHPLITMLQQECTRASCPEMKAGEWLYLCVAHGNDGAMEQCCAIDYILHTLDSATALLNSPRAFPSRLSIPQTSHRHFSSLARRLGRIFAHAYFHHREAFEQAEAESSLYARFLALTSKFDLVPAEFLVIPPRLTVGEGRSDVDVQPPRLLAAAIDPQGDRGHSVPRGLGGSLGHSIDRVSGSETESGSESARDMGLRNERAKSTSPPGLGSDSPRKVGRNRTYTMVFSEAFNAAEELTKGVGHEENAGLFVEESDAGPSGLSPSSDSARPHDDETPTTDASEVALQDPPSPKIEEEPIPSPDAESIALGSAFDAESPVNMFTFTLSEEFGSTGLELPPEITVLAPDPQPVAPILAIPEVTATSMTDSETTLPVEPKHLIVSIPEAEGSDSEPEPTEHMRSDVHCHASELQAAPTEAPGISAEPAAIESEPEPEQAADSVLPHEAHAIEPARAIPDVDPTAEIARAEGPTIHLEEKPNEKTGTETGAEQPAENSPSTTAETLDATAIDPTVTDTDSVHLNPDDLEASDFLPHPENATHSQAPPVVDDHAESSEPQVHGDA